eukprot:891561-Amorphochlora_amoeboformis.AAC.1
MYVRSIRGRLFGRRHIAVPSILHDLPFPRCNVTLSHYTTHVDCSKQTQPDTEEWDRGGRRKEPLEEGEC